MCASWLARYGANPNAMPAQIAGERRAGQPSPEQIGEEPREREGEQEADVVGARSG